MTNKWERGAKRRFPSGMTNKWNDKQMGAGYERRFPSGMTNKWNDNKWNDNKGSDNKKWRLL